MHGVPFWGRFWCAVRRFWAPFWCTVPILGPISVHGAPFLGSILVRCLFGIDFGAWCADVGVDHSQRATRSIKIGEDLGGIEPETCRTGGLGPGA